MISVGFKRISKRVLVGFAVNPPIVAFTGEGTSICMRISAGSRGLSRNGGNIDVHPEIPFITIDRQLSGQLAISSAGSC